MRKPSLRVKERWVPRRVPLDVADARQLYGGKSCEPIKPHEATHIRMIHDESVWVELLLGNNRWIAAHRITFQNKRWIVAEIRIFPNRRTTSHAPGEWRGMYDAAARVPSGGVTSRLLREVKEQTFRRVLRAVLEQHSKKIGELFPSVNDIAPPKRSDRGRKGRSDLELARIAKVYERAFCTNQSTHAAVAKAFNLSRSQARDAILRARVRGLLSEADKAGKGGGNLTAVGRALLSRTTKGGKHGTK